MSAFRRLIVGDLVRVLHGVHAARVGTIRELIPNTRTGDEAIVEEKVYPPALVGHRFQVQVTKCALAKT